MRHSFSISVVITIMLNIHMLDIIMIIKLIVWHMSRSVTHTGPQTQHIIQTKHKIQNFIKKAEYAKQKTSQVSH